METNNFSRPNAPQPSNSHDRTDVNNLLKKSQSQIIMQITKTQNLIYQQMIFIILLALSMVLFLIPYFINQSSPQKKAYGVMIMSYFFMSFYVQFQRKLPHLNKSREFLRNIKKNASFGNQTSFFNDIAQYLAKLYEVLFFDRKANKLSCDFMEQEGCTDTAEVEKRIMRSLKNDLIINFILGVIFIISAILALVLMNDRINLIHSLIMFSVLVLNFLILISTCLKLQDTLKKWMDGFINLRTWASFIENMIPEVKIPEKKTLEIQRPTLCFCPDCGEPKQKYGTFCQHCGRKIDDI